MGNWGFFDRVKQALALLWEPRKDHCLLTNNNILQKIWVLLSYPVLGWTLVSDMPLVVVGPNFELKTMAILPPRKVLHIFRQDAENLIAFSHATNARHPELTL